MAALLVAGRELDLGAEKKKKLWKQGFRAGKGKELVQIIGRKRKAEEETYPSQDLQLMAPATFGRDQSPMKRARQEETRMIVETEDISAEVEARLKARRKKSKSKDGKRRRSSGFSENETKRRRKRRSSGGVEA